MEDAAVVVVVPLPKVDKVPMVHLEVNTKAQWAIAVSAVAEEDELLWRWWKKWDRG